ncbi:MAG: heavy-metal-associated domain-containing protein [Nannocystis sp.]|nr:heavy-metal-associated domain-containing protein [Nannocystis sp.]
MRRALLSILLALAATALACGPGAPEPLAASALTTTELRVEGMVCGSCEGAITAELQKLDGVDSATADHQAQRVTVRHDPSRASVDAIIAAIDRLGYAVVR